MSKLKIHIIWAGWCLLLLAACSPQLEKRPIAITRCAECPIGLTNARPLVVGNKAYIWGGRSTQEPYSKGVYIYDAEEDNWTYDQDIIPIKTRVRATVCALGDDIYLGLGFHGQYYIDSTYLQDWWRWTPKTNEWKRLCDFPNKKTLHPVAFTDGKDIYTAFGSLDEETREVYRYDVEKDNWTKLADHISGRHTFPSCAAAVAAADCDGHHYVGTGVFWYSMNYWAEMIPDGNRVKWKKLADVPGRGRSGAVASSYDHHVYLSGGRYVGGTVTNGEVYKDVLQYHPDQDKWTLVATLPDGPRENMVSFVIGNRVYFGLGNDKYNIPCQQLYSIQP